MNMEYIRKTYCVPAKRGARVTFRGNSGTIVGSRQHRLRIRLDGVKSILTCHPTWKIEYKGK